MELAAIEARYDKIHEELPYHDGTFKVWSAERSERFPYHYRDGVRLWISKDPDESENIFRPPARGLLPTDVAD